MAVELGVAPKELVGNGDLVAKIDPAKYTDEKLGAETLRDILEELKRPGRDPRGDFSGPAFRSDVTSIKDLKEGMVLEGVVTNVTNFGAFVDVGVHQDGLVHVSEISHHFVKDPTEAVKVGERVQVKVLGVEGNRKRISLSIKATQPAPAVPERPPRPPRPPRERRPNAAGEAQQPRGDRRPRRRPGPPAPAVAKDGTAPPPSKAPAAPRPAGPRPPRPGGFAPRAPKKVGTHGRKALPVSDRGFMGKDRGPREKVPRQKGPDTSLGALFGDLLKNPPDKS
jgi:uncharacterized protein